MRPRQRGLSVIVKQLAASSRHRNRAPDLVPDVGGGASKPESAAGNCKKKHNKSETIINRAPAVVLPNGALTADAIGARHALKHRIAVRTHGREPYQERCGEASG